MTPAIRLVSLCAVLACVSALAQARDPRPEREVRDLNQAIGRQDQDRQNNQQLQFEFNQLRSRQDQQRQLPPAGRVSGCIGTAAC